MTSKTIKDLLRDNDPLFVDDSPVGVFDWKMPKGAQRLFITSAQNATPVHLDFWRVIQRICEDANAALVVIPLRYKNPTSRWVGSQEGASHWVEEVRPYLASVRRQLNANLMLLGDIKIQPTAADPLTGFESVSDASSGIVGHPKIQTRSIATPQSKMAKLLLTSGACTVQNYSDTRAGRVGEFHHSLSGLMVELDGPLFWVRRLHYDTRTKSVIDAPAAKRYTADRAVTAPRSLALACGDLHERFADPKVISATWGAGGMVEVARPQHVIYHDVTDAYAVNHHHGKNPFFRIGKRRSGMDDLRAEVEHTIEFLRDHPTPGGQSVIVPSNHPDFFARWMAENDWRQDPVNAQFYLETALMMVRGCHTDRAKGTSWPDPFAHWLRSAKIPNTRVLDDDESFALAGVELGMHGHLGPNGRRGSIRNIRRIGVKSIIGHSHSPGEDEGCTQVGTSTRLRLEYNHGPSSWLQAHCFLNADGKRQLCFIINGRYKL
jgi:hypothetical protein